METRMEWKLVSKLEISNPQITCTSSLSENFYFGTKMAMHSFFSNNLPVSSKRL